MSLGKIESQVQTALQKFEVQANKTQDEVKDSPRKSFIPVRAKPPPQKLVELQSSLAPSTSVQGEKKTIQKSKKHNMDFVASLRNKESVAERKSKETIQLFASKEIMRPETETESESEPEVQAKPSTSTLGQYSSRRYKTSFLIFYTAFLSASKKFICTCFSHFYIRTLLLISIKNFRIEEAAASEEVFDKLREEVEILVHRRLKEIGVSPDWKGLPQRSFTQALAVVNHQAELSKKVLKLHLVELSSFDGLLETSTIYKNPQETYKATGSYDKNKE